MIKQQGEQLNNGDYCIVIGGTHVGKSGKISDIHKSKTGHITITVEQPNGIKFKTLGKNATVKNDNT